MRRFTTATCFAPALIGTRLHANARTKFHRVASIVAAAIVPFVLAAPAAAAPQDKAQQKCINSVNKAAAKLSDTSGKLTLGCVKSLSNGDGSAENCIAADEKGKVGKAETKLIETADAL